MEEILIYLKGVVKGFSFAHYRFKIPVIGWCFSSEEPSKHIVGLLIKHPLGKIFKGVLTTVLVSLSIQNFIELRDPIIYSK